MVYYANTPNGVECLTETEYKTLFGDPLYRSYATQYYQGIITLNDIPEDYREAVVACGVARTNRWGAYIDQNATSEEIMKSVQELVKLDMTKGEITQLFIDLQVLRENTTDAVASMAISVYPCLQENGKEIKAGTRINWNGTLKRATVTIWDTKENNPDNAPTLWEDIQYRKGYRIIPDIITVGLAFSKDEIGWWGDELMRSLVDSNIYTPDQYPSNWEIVNNI